MIHPRISRALRHAAMPGVVLAAVLAAGCQPQGEPDVAAPGPAAPDATEPAADAADAGAGADKALPTHPALRVATLDHGDYDVANHRGTWVVVNFWATWCAPCLKEMPELSALDAMNEHVEVVGLAYEDIDVPAMR